MASRRPADDTDDDLDDLLDEPSGGPPRSHHRRARPSSGSAPVRRWRRGDQLDDLDDDGLDLDGSGRRRAKPPVFWRARDSLYFEPLVALAILAVLLVSLFAYTSNWPPVYVIESNSMQHGSGDHLGDLNAGDIVLAEKLGLGQIVTYVQGVQSGFSTYGLAGDVILYYPNGTTSSTPIIHRAIIYLQWNANRTYDAIGLSPSECGNGTGLYSTITSSGPSCVTNGLSIEDKLILYHVRDRTIAVDFGFTTELGDHSGFLTLGDNNTHPDQAPGAPHLSTLVEPGWVIGVARGMIPWFGSIKLLLDGRASKVPTASWEYLGLTVAGIIFASAGLHLLFRRRRAHDEEERPRRTRRPVPSELEDDEPRGAPPPRRGPSPVKPWQAAAEPEPPAAPAAPKRLSHEQRRRAHFVTSREPHPPRRRRSEEPDDRASADDDDT